jgi:hypothetical protein
MEYGMEVRLIMDLKGMWLVINFIDCIYVRIEDDDLIYVNSEACLETYTFVIIKDQTSKSEFYEVQNTVW